MFRMAGMRVVALHHSFGSRIVMRRCSDRLHDLPGSKRFAASCSPLEGDVGCDAPT